MGSAGSQDPTLQSFRPKICNLAHFTGNSEGNEHTIPFRVPIPDPRLRAKVTLLWVPAGSTPPDDSNFTPPTTTLWLYEAEEEDAGNSGRTFPCTDIEGTQAAPTAIATGGLTGYSREIISAADYVEGIVTVDGAIAANDSFLVLQTRYSPQSVRFTPEEWDEITRRCTPNAGSCLLIP